MTFNQQIYQRAIWRSFGFSFLTAGFIAILVLIPWFKNGSKSGYLYSAPVVFMAVAFIVFWQNTRRIRRRKKIVSEPFPKQWEKILQTRVVYYVALGDVDRASFRRQLQIFLDEKLITGVGTDVDDETRLLVAVSAIIPIFKIPDWEYNKLDEVLVYPANFNDSFDFSAKNASAMGMVVANTSCVILSKPALLNGFYKSKDGLNTGIHEFIHKIDHQDGVIDGVPASLMNAALRKKWSAVVESEMAQMMKRKSDIDAYAVTNKAEFFGVVSEYFFENPAKLAEKHPRLYEIMVLIYRQDNRSRLKSAVLDLFGRRPKKVGRNSPCPCGSGRKYKYCCLP